MAPDAVRLIVAIPEKAELIYFDTVTDKEIKKVQVDFKPGAVQFTNRLCRERLLPLMADCPAGAAPRE
jgi:hypothetical protein